MKYIVSCFLLLILILGCQKEIKIDQEKIKNKLVLNSILSNQMDTVWVSLTESRDLLYDKYQFPSVENATVTLFEEGNLVGELSYLQEQYYIEKKVEPGKTYSIEASYEGFDAIKASTTVPIAGDLKTVSADLNENMRVNVDMLISDNSTEENYYGISVKRKDISLDTNYQFGDYYNTYSCTNEFITTYPKPDLAVGSICAQEFLLNDNAFKNTTYNFNLFSDSYLYGFEDLQVEIIAYFNTYNADYFQYSVSRAVYNDNYGNPFSEPVQVYNNIENGYGIFGAVNTVISDTLIIE